MLAWTDHEAKCSLTPLWRAVFPVHCGEIIPRVSRRQCQVSDRQGLVHKVTSRQSMPHAGVAFSLMHMRHASSSLSAAMGLVALIVLLATTAVPVQGGDVFQCPDGKGGIVLRDVPCSVSASDKQPPALSPDTPSHLPKEAVPPSHKRATSPSPKTLAPRSSHCLSVQSVKAQTQSHDQVAVELAWEVAVQNQCKQSMSAVLTFTLYGSRNLALDAESTKIMVSADGVGTIHGIMRVSRENMRRMNKYDAKLSVL